MSNANNTALVTPEFRVSFPSVDKPSSVPGSNSAPKYGLVMLIPKTTDITPLRQAMEAAVIAAFPDASKRPKLLKNPIRDGDVEKAELDGYKGHWFIAARSVNKPGVVDQNVQPIIDPSQFYAGCYARAKVVAFYFDKAGNKGVAFGLQNVQKLRDGEPFAGGSKPEDDFGPVSSAPAVATPGAASDMFA